MCVGEITCYCTGIGQYNVAVPDVGHGREGDVLLGRLGTAFGCDAFGRALKLQKKSAISDHTTFLQHHIDCLRSVEGLSKQLITVILSTTQEAWRDSGHTQHYNPINNLRSVEVLSAYSTSQSY
jgi:hypothetical protein